MQKEKLRVLLVEDNPGDARLVQEMLSAHEAGGFEVVHTARLEEALKRLSKEAFDAVLLDLSLPDSSGVATLDKARIRESQESAPSDKRTPIVVITGREGHEEEDLDSVHHGAEDYLEKSTLRADILIRSIQFAVERHRQRQRSSDEQDESRQKREMASLESIEAPPHTSVTAQTYGFSSLEDAAPDTVEMLIGQYCDLALQGVENRKFELDRKPNQALRVMAQRLGFLRAGPRDVVSLHIKALKRLKPGKMAHSYALSEEARLLLIELMGNLTAYYRDHMMPASRPRPRSDQQQVGGKSTP